MSTFLLSLLSLSHYLHINNTITITVSQVRLEGNLTHCHVLTVDIVHSPCKIPVIQNTLLPSISATNTHYRRCLPCHRCCQHLPTSHRSSGSRWCQRRRRSLTVKGSISHFIWQVQLPLAPFLGFCCQPSYSIYSYPPHFVSFTLAVSPFAMTTRSTSLLDHVLSFSDIISSPQVPACLL